IRLPVVGRIEAYVIWTRDNRAGFQFERIIRLDDFVTIIDQLQPNPRLRKQR
ncbi:MAG TPA: PilZ domain-containing protein, partial [Erythrobacter sp.]|nr:PilZ domain-containing protein [Erythrobacter sp.]